MKLCLGYNAVQLKGQQKIFIVKNPYITGSELSNLFGEEKDTQYTNLSNNELVTENALVLLNNEKIVFEKDGNTAAS